MSRRAKHGKYRGPIGRRGCDLCSGSGFVAVVKKSKDGTPYTFSDKCACVSKDPVKKAPEGQEGLFR